MDDEDDLAEALDDDHRLAAGTPQLLRKWEDGLREMLDLLNRAADKYGDPDRFAATISDRVMHMECCGSGCGVRYSRGSGGALMNVRGFVTVDDADVSAVLRAERVLVPVALPWGTAVICDADGRYVDPREFWMARSEFLAALP